MHQLCLTPAKSRRQKKKTPSFINRSRHSGHPPSSETPPSVRNKILYLKCPPSEPRSIKKTLPEPHSRPKTGSDSKHSGSLASNTGSIKSAALTMFETPTITPLCPSQKYRPGQRNTVGRGKHSPNIHHIYLTPAKSPSKYFCVGCQVEA